MATTWALAFGKRLVGGRVDRCIGPHTNTNEVVSAVTTNVIRSVTRHRQAGPVSHEGEEGSRQK